MSDLLTPGTEPSPITGEEPLHERSRVWQHLAGIIVALALAGLIVVGWRSQIDWSVVGDFVFDETVLLGFAHTVLISVLSMLLGLVIGVAVALMRLSRNPIVSTIAYGYVWLFRGSPVLLQILMWYNIALIFPTIGVPGFEVKTVDVISAFVAALLALGFNEGAYLAEIIRGGILSVDQGQREAANALGIASGRTYTHIVLPQAMPAIIPAIGNQFIGLLKMSSFASVISYPELLERVQSIYYTNAKVMELLIVATVWYVVATTAASIGQYYLERRFGRSTSKARRTPTGGLWARTRRAVAA